MSNKVCKCCGTEKPLEAFSVNRAAKDGLQRHCRECDKKRQRAEYQAKIEEKRAYGRQYNRSKKDNHEWRLNQLLQASRERARAKDREHDICLEDLIEAYPEDGKCPVYGFPLEWGTNNQRESSPSIDRIDSTRGYTKDNIQIISWKANRIKGYASIEDLEILLAYLKRGG